MRVRRGLLETDLWGQISVLLLLLLLLLLSAFWLVGAIMKNRRASRERVCESFVNVLVRAL